MQDPALDVKIRTEPDSRFVIPDVALTEMCKHQNCHLTMKLALQSFGMHTQRVEVAFSIGEALNAELKSLTPTTPEELISKVFTNFGRELITNLQNGTETEQTIQEKFSTVRNQLFEADKDLDAVGAKKRTEEFLKILRKSLPEKFVAAIRKSNFDCKRLLYAVQALAETFARQELIKEHNVKREDAQRFIEERPLYVRYYYLLLRHCLFTLQAGGDISSMRPEKELNHQLDLDYVLIASYFDGLLSHDKRVQEAHTDLLAILATQSDEAHIQFQEWFIELGIISSDSVEK